MIKGTTSSTGVAYGKIFILDVLQDTGSLLRDEGFDADEEIERFDTAVAASLEDLLKLRQEVRVKIGEREEKIFEAQSLILEDPALVDEVKSRIVQYKLTADEALRGTIINLEQQFLEIEDKTIRQRIADIKDVGSRLLRELGRERAKTLESIESPVVLVTGELLPSQAARLDKEKILAIVTEKGGINSHASIIARSLDIPAIVGARGVLKQAVKSEAVIVDGFTASVYFDPEPSLVEKYREIKASQEVRKQPEETDVTGGLVTTLDGAEIQLFANIGRLSELNKLKEYGVDGVGILRSEFLLLKRESPPSVEDFRANYTTILDFMTPRPVNIRLLDLGADKKFPFLSQPRETNPALGNRGVRYLLGNPHLLKSQIQGILEASPAGEVSVLLPMVTTIQEVREITSLFRRVEMELCEEGKNVKTHIPIGMMIETPATAMLAGKFASEVDFFSIGTNDLTQYTLAADRENDSVMDIYNSLNPAVLKLIKESIKGSKRKNLKITICGEMASSLKALPILLGMGITRLSIGVNNLPEVRDVIRKIEMKKAKTLAKKALRAYDVMEVEKLVARFLRKMEKKHRKNR